MAWMFSTAALRSCVELIMAEDDADGVAEAGEPEDEDGGADADAAAAFCLNSAGDVTCRRAVPLPPAKSSLVIHCIELDMRVSTSAVCMVCFLQQSTARRPTTNFP